MQGRGDPYVCPPPPTTTTSKRFGGGEASMIGEHGMGGHHGRTNYSVNKFPSFLACYVLYNFPLIMPASENRRPQSLARCREGD